MSFEGQIMNKIYHGCTAHYANGERKLIDLKSAKDPCCQRLSPFGNSQTPKVVGCCMQTRNSTKKRILIVGPFKTIYV